MSPNAQFLAFLAAQLPQPVERKEEKGGIVLVGGDPAEVVIGLAESHVLVWEGPSLSERPAIGAVWWESLPGPAEETAVQALITVARNVHWFRYRICSSCERSLPPEWMQGVVCQGCVEREPGVVH